MFSFEIETKKVANISTSPDEFIIPIIPKYNGNWIRIPLALKIDWLIAIRNSFKFLCKKIKNEFNPDLIFLPNFASLPHIIFQLYFNTKNKNVLALSDAMVGDTQIFTNDYLDTKGYFIFTQREDLWKDLNFDNVLKSRSDFGLIYKSRPLNYLPKNKDFGSNIKIRIVLLVKK